MRNTVKLTKLNEKKITEDWQREIPSLGIYQPRHLLRRVGPLLMGICLDRNSGGDIYKPTFHVHSLASESPCVSLMLGSQLRSVRSGGPDYIEVRWHEQKYKEAAARMVRQSLFPLEGDLPFTQVMAVYQQRLDATLIESPVHLYRDMILLSAWAGDSQGSLILLAKCLQVNDDPQKVTINSMQCGKIITERVEVIESPNFRHVGGRVAFEAECRKLIENPALIQQTVDSQIVALGIANLPVANLFR